MANKPNQNTKANEKKEKRKAIVRIVVILLIFAMLATYCLSIVGVFK